MKDYILEDFRSIRQKAQPMIHYQLLNREAAEAADYDLLVRA
jgi:hypothetical protein